MKKRTILSIAVSIIMVLAILLVSSCNCGTAADTTKPGVSSTNPGNSATGVAVNSEIGITFSEAMDPSTVTGTTFTVKRGTTPVSGTVTYSGKTATFTPSANLAANTEYTATITTGVKDLAGNALAGNKVWSFKTGASGASTDTTAPEVTLTINENGATDVPVNTKVGIFFNEDMNPSTITTTTFTLKKGSTPVSGTVHYSGRAALFTPSANLAANTEYTATITTGAKDLAGNSLTGSYIWKWTTAAAPDTTAPMMSSSIPIHGTTDVAINSAISAAFSEAMDPLTITTTTFTLKNGTASVSGVVTYAGVTATFKPSANLAANTEYTATITTGAKDLAGNALTSNRVWSFTTGAAPDTAAPTVSSTVPINAAANVAINNAVTATFSEAVDPLTVTTTTFTLMKGTVPVSGVVTYAGVTATFKPGVDLAAGTVYTAKITTGVKDLAGNALAADKVWTFTTLSSSGGGGGTPADTLSPTVSSTIPANTATGVAINSNISTTFSEALNPLTVTTVTFTVKQGVTPVTGVVTYAGVIATFNPDASLASSTVYTATITTGVKDLAGNALAVNKVWTFTTGAAADTVAPTVSSTIPADAATGVAINSNVSATFSEAMSPSTITNVNFTLKQGVTDVPGAVTYVGVIATYNPDTNLTASTVYTATITTGVKDLAGNPLAVDKVWTFTTGAAADTTAPTVSSTSPANLATGVAVSSNITSTFSEAMDPLTITNVAFTLKQGVTNVPGAVTYAGVIATFNPDADLAVSTVYTANVSIMVTDLAGNHLAVDKVWSFTTGAAAIANPTAPVLGEAGRFVILAYSAVTTTGVTAISNGDIGVTPAARTFITGFTPSGSEGAFDELVNGKSYAPEDANPAPFPYPLHYSTPVVGAPWTTTGAMLTQALADLNIAYTFLAADPNPSAPTQVCPIELGTLTLTRGVYKTAFDVTITTGDLTLDAQGDPDSVWIFTIDGNLTTGAPGGNIILANGAQAKNIYWRTGGFTVIGSATNFYGSVFSWTQINVLNGAHITGSLFAVTEQVTLIGDTVTKAP